MSSRYVTETFWAWMQANWAETRLIDPMNTFADVEVAGSPLAEWTTVMPDGAVETQVSVGSPGDQRWREDGGFSLIAFVPSGTGTDRPLELAEMLRDLVRGRQISAGAGQPTIVFRGVDPPETATPSSVSASSGDWFGYAVAATYYCDFCR